MREPISRDSGSPRELAEATRRLDRALEHLEAACAAKSATPGAPDEASLADLERDRARLAAELDAARLREADLEAAAAAASQALGRAAAEVRAALDEGRLDDDGGAEIAQQDGDGLDEEAA